LLSFSTSTQVESEKVISQTTTTNPVKLLRHFPTSPEDDLKKIKNGRQPKKRKTTSKKVEDNQPLLAFT
jgi:hypothetical protein